MGWQTKHGIIKYVTPMEYVLEGIRRVCNAKEVKLVVRKEDETDIVFGPPKRRNSGEDQERPKRPHLEDRDPLQDFQ